MTNLFQQEPWELRGANEARIRALETKLALIETGLWVPWTPTLTNITQGNGTVFARYTRVGRTIHYRLKFQLGSTSAVGTDPQFTLPAAPVSASGYAALDILGRVRLGDIGTADYDGVARLNTGSTCYMLVLSAAGSYSSHASITATIPFTWTTNDDMFVSGTYEAAS